MTETINICEECNLPMVECSAIASARDRCEEYLRNAGYRSIDARNRADELIKDPKKSPAWRTFDTAPSDGKEIIVDTGAVIWWGDINAADSGEADHAPNFCWLVSDGKNDPIHYRGWTTVKRWMPFPEANQ